jgi:anti-sigma factor RsiW
VRIERRKHREWTARLSDYLSGELPEAEKLAVETHLSACDDCSAALRDLARIVDEADELGEIEPPRDLWPDIAAAIRSQPQRGSQLEADDDPQVIRLPGAGRRVSAAVPGRIEVSRRGLVAASVVLVASTAAATWWAGRSSATIAENPGGLASSGAVSPAGVAAPPEGMAGELAILEDVMASARSVLDPNTVRVLERNLGVIEQAIADSREALAQDPGNAFLVQHLERMYRRKLVYLQDAVRLVEFGG